MKAYKEQRLIIANMVINEISSCGRKFFRYKDNIGFFKLNTKTGHLYWVCEYTKKPIYMGYKYWLFHHGGTLHHLISTLAEYIRGNQEFPIHLFGPWPENFCGGDLWGYGINEMDILREKIKTIIQNG